MKELIKVRMLYAAAFLIPCAGIAISRILPIGKGVSTAQASTTDHDAEQMAFHMPDLGVSAIKTTADAAVDAVRTKTFGKSPVWAPVQVVAQSEDVNMPQSPAPTGESKQKTALAELKAIEVSSILTGRQPLAVIAGKPRKVGDEIRAGWKITSIDPATGIIGVIHPDAGEERLHLRKKIIEDSTAGSSGVRTNPTPANR